MRVRRFLILIALLLGFLEVVSGCSKGGGGSTSPGSTPPPSTVNSGSQQDPRAKPVEIGPTYSVSPGHLELHKKIIEMGQWHNTSSDTLLLQLKGDPIGLLIPASEWSGSYHVNIACQNGTYDYKILHRVNGLWQPAISDSGPPTTPDIIVED